MIDSFTVGIGIIFALIGTFCVNYGVALQKKGLKEGLPELKVEDGIVTTFLIYFKNKSWTIGFFLGFFGFIPYVIAQGFVGILIVQPIQSVGLIIMVIAANKLLDEKISQIELIAIGMLVFAPFLIAFSGITDVAIDLSVFIFPFLIFLIIIIIIILLLVYFGKKVNGEGWSGLFKVMVAGLAFSIGAMFSNILAQAYINASINIVSPFGWVEILFGIFFFEFFHLWVFLGLYGMLASNIIGIIFQNNGMQKGKAVELWPIQSTINTMVPVFGGIFVFRQSVLNPILFCIALALILIATIILSRYQAD